MEGIDSTADMMVFVMPLCLYPSLKNIQTKTSLFDSQTSQRVDHEKNIHKKLKQRIFH